MQRSQRPSALSVASWEEADLTLAPEPASAPAADKVQPASTVRISGEEEEIAGLGGAPAKGSALSPGKSRDAWSGDAWRTKSGTRGPPKSSGAPSGTPSAKQATGEQSEAMLERLYHFKSDKARAVTQAEAARPTPLSADLRQPGIDLRQPGTSPRNVSAAEDATALAGTVESQPVDAAMPLTPHPRHSPPVNLPRQMQLPSGMMPAPA